ELVRHSLCVEVNVELPAKGEPLTSSADANQLQQVLINLALNARDALTKPEPLLFRMYRRILTGELPAFPESVPPGDYVVLEVRDHGKGMAAEILNQALDPFFTTKEVGQGTGLCLPVAFGIMHGHGGYLTLDSRSGEGTTARLFLPRLIGQAPAARAGQRQAGEVLDAGQSVAG